MSVTVRQLLQFPRERRIAPLVLRQIAQWSEFSQALAHEAIAAVYQDLCEVLSETVAPIFQGKREVEDDGFVIEYCIRDGAICFLSIQKKFVPGGSGGSGGSAPGSGVGPRTHTPSKGRGGTEPQSLAKLLSTVTFAPLIVEETGSPPIFDETMKDVRGLLWLDEIVDYLLSDLAAGAALPLDPRLRGYAPGGGASVEVRHVCGAPALTRLQAHSIVTDDDIMRLYGSERIGLFTWHYATGPGNLRARQIPVCYPVARTLRGSIARYVFREEYRLAAPNRSSNGAPDAIGGMHLVGPGTDGALRFGSNVGVRAFAWTEQPAGIGAWTKCQARPCDLADFRRPRGITADDRPVCNCAEVNLRRARHDRRRVAGASAGTGDGDRLGTAAAEPS